MFLKFSIFDGKTNHKLFATNITILNKYKNCNHKKFTTKLDNKLKPSCNMHYFVLKILFLVCTFYCWFLTNKFFLIFRSVYLKIKILSHEIFFLFDFFCLMHFKQTYRHEAYIIKYCRDIKRPWALSIWAARLWVSEIKDLKYTYI